MTSARNSNINKHLKAGVVAFRESWSDQAILGDAARFVYKAAVPYVMHPAVAAMGIINLAFLAANGVKVAVRQSGAKVLESNCLRQGFLSKIPSATRFCSAHGSISELEFRRSAHAQRHAARNQNR